MEEQTRLAAFNWLRTQCERYGDVLPWSILIKGFDFNGERITLVGPRGIWKPKQFQQKPLSITTVFNSRYDDGPASEGFYHYKYQGNDPYHPDNVGLTLAMRERTPLVYFLAVDKGYYMVNFPVYIIGDDPSKLEFTVAVDERKFLIDVEMNDSGNQDQAAFIRRKYITSVTRIRAHQQGFRIRVVKAYDTACCLCKINHFELLDAAHIIPDSEPQGDPIVPNGMTLCKIHHAAFDSNIIGISPDYQITVRTDILNEIDGPMLKHGIQELNNHKIILPTHRKDYPDKERLNWRFERFMKAG
jgi:putative restriction endonuclease